MIESLRELLRGEPVYLRGLVIAVLTAAGLKVGEGTVDYWIGVAAPVLLALITRPATTPAVNPAQPTTIAVKQDDGEVPADLPPLALPPVRTITGQRRG
jgi:hypothetical protein